MESKKYNYVIVLTAAGSLITVEHLMKTVFYGFLIFYIEIYDKWKPKTQAICSQALSTSPSTTLSYTNLKQDHICDNKKILTTNFVSSSTRRKNARNHRNKKDAGEKIL